MLYLLYKNSINKKLEDKNYIIHIFIFIIIFVFAFRKENSFLCYGNYRKMFNFDFIFFLSLKEY